MGDVQATGQAFRAAVERWDIAAVRELLARWTSSFTAPSRSIRLSGARPSGRCSKSSARRSENFRYVDELSGPNTHELDLPRLDRRPRARRPRPPAPRRGRPDRGLHSHDPCRCPVSVPFAQQMGEKVQAAGIGNDDAPERARRCAARCSVSGRTSATAARTCRPPSMRWPRRASRLSPLLERLRHRPRRRGARPAELPECLPARRDDARAARAARRRQAARARARTHRAGGPPRPAADRHRHPAARRARAAARADERCRTSRYSAAASS